MPDKAALHLPHALRILARDIHCEDGIATQCIREAADEIERLRLTIRRLAEQDATLSVRDGNVTVEMDATLCRHSRATVRLPREPEDFEISEANGYAAAIEDVKRALTEAGIDWVE